MPVATMPISDDTNKTLSEIAAREGKPVRIVLDKAVEEYRRHCFFMEANSAYTALRKDRKAWKVDIFNHGPAGLVVVLPITSREKGIPFHVGVDPPEGGLHFTKFHKARRPSLYCKRASYQATGNRNLSYTNGSRRSTSNAPQSLSIN